MAIRIVLTQATELHVQQIQKPDGTHRIIQIDDAAGISIAFSLDDTGWRNLIAAGTGLHIPHPGNLN